MALLDTHQEHEADSLGHLEERIQKAVQLVSRLRQEKEAALKDAADAKTHSARLQEELDALRSERKAVRTRIEKLLGHIDQLGAS